MIYPLPPTSPGDEVDPDPVEAEGPIGPFPSWSWVYGTVLVWGVVVIVVLTVLTHFLSFGRGP